MINFCKKERKTWEQNLRVNNMPYSIRKSGSGFKVVNRKTGKAFSGKPISKNKAKKQVAALHINVKEAFDILFSKIIKKYSWFFLNLDYNITKYR